MTNNLKKYQLNELLGAKESLRLTILQINKDLRAFTKEEISPGLSSLEELFNRLSIIITQLQDGNFSNFQGFIYRVDIDEKTFTQYLQSRDIDLLTKAVIRREALKIYFKSKFSSE